jgi:hypothetical protein
MRMTTLTIALATVMAVTAAVPVMAANDEAQSSQAKPAQIKHSMSVRHQHRANLQTRENGTLVPRSTANANASFANANASAGAPVKDESMAYQLGRTVTVPGNASDPICKPGTLTPLGDGQMHSCQ